jgi:tetratricopeptide (TPR) repeat protein
VISGFLNKDDFALLDEFPCTDLLEKPFTKSLIEQKIFALSEEFKWYNEQQEVIADLLLEFKNDGPSAVKSIKKIFNESPNPFPIAILAAKLLRTHDFLEESKTVLELVLKDEPNSVAAIGELGKVVFQLGDLKQSKRILRLANRLSPENLKRLCLLGEIDLNLQKPEEARKYFESALNIDSDDKIANSGYTISTNMEHHLVNHNKHSIPQSFASLLNIIAITQVKSGEFQDGIDQYKASLSFLTANIVIAKVAFNVGLGFMRWSKPEHALPWFIKSAETGGQAFSKSSYYVQQLNKRGIIAAVEENSDDAVSVTDADIQSKVSEVDQTLQQENDDFSIAEADDFFNSIEGSEIIGIDDEDMDDPIAI